MLTAMSLENMLFWPSVFGEDFRILKNSDNDVFTPSYARLPAIVEETFVHLSANGESIDKTLNKEMLNYYATALLWARILKIKAELSDVESRYVKLMQEMEFNVPQPIYYYLTAIGNVQDKMVNNLCLGNHVLPITVGRNKGGYHGDVISTENHNLFEEVPCLGICADILMAMAGDQVIQPYFPVLPDNTQPTENLLGYFGQAYIPKIEIRILLNSVGITNDQFKENLTNTRLNLKLIQHISDCLSSSKTFKNERVKINALTTEGNRSQLIKSIPNGEDNDPNTRWVNKEVRLLSVAQEPLWYYGLSYMTGFQLTKEATGGSHQNWCCITSLPNQQWQIPQDWIENRNARRTLPDGFGVENFEAQTDSQQNRTNAYIRSMIITT